MFTIKDFIGDVRTKAGFGFGLNRSRVLLDRGEDCPDTPEPLPTDVAAGLIRLAEAIERGDAIPQAVTYSDQAKVDGFLLSTIEIVVAQKV